MNKSQPEVDKSELMVNIGEVYLSFARMGCTCHGRYSKVNEVMKYSFTL